MSALTETDKDNGLNLLKKHSRHLCDPIPQMSFSGKRKVDTVFVTFTAASTYATGRGMILSWL